MGTRLNRLAKAVLTCTHSQCFEQKYENSKKNITENSHFYIREISLYIAWECFRNGGFGISSINMKIRKREVSDQRC